MIEDTFLSIPIDFLIKLLQKQVFWIVDLKILIRFLVWFNEIMIKSELIRFCS